MVMCGDGELWRLLTVVVVVRVLMVMCGDGELWRLSTVCSDGKLW